MQTESVDREGGGWGGGGQVYKKGVLEKFVKFMGKLAGVSL